MKSPAPNPWEQGQGFPAGHRESNRHYDAFRAFLLMGPGRSLVSVEQVMHLSYSTVRSYSSRYCWPQRTKAYDDAHPEEKLGAHALATASMPGPRPSRYGLPPLERAEAIQKYQLAQERHKEQLEDHRKRCDELGRLQLSLAINMAVLAENCLQEHQRYREDPSTPAPYMSIQSIQRLCSASFQLGSSGRELEGQALAVDNILEVVCAIRAKDAEKGSPLGLTPMGNGGPPP
jgi:hypothetical protein